MKKDECEKWKYGNTYKDTITKKTSFLFQLFISFLSFQNIHHAWKQYERHRRNARSRIESMKRNDFMMQSILHDIDFILLLMNCTFCTLHDVCLIMKNNERAVQNDIVKFITELWRYAVSVQLWSMMKRSRSKKWSDEAEWKWKMYKITLAPQWTPDIFACIDGRFFWIEVKKDEKERKARCWIAERYTNDAKEPKSRERQIAQFKTWTKIAWCKWIFLCTYGVQHLIDLFRSLEKSEQIKILSPVNDW